MRNGSECLGDKQLPSMLSPINASEGCRGGRGGQNASDVYRLTSKKAIALCNMVYGNYRVPSLDYGPVFVTFHQKLHLKAIFTVNFCVKSYNIADAHIKSKAISIDRQK